MILSLGLTLPPTQVSGKTYRLLFLGMLIFHPTRAAIALVIFLTSCCYCTGYHLKLGWVVVKHDLVLVGGLRNLLRVALISIPTSSRDYNKSVDELKQLGCPS
jgi:hypothetical protein